MLAGGETSRQQGKGKGVRAVFAHPQHKAEYDVGLLRKQAGQWLKQLRLARGLSQRALAKQIEVEYYTFISALEAGRGRIPPNRYRIWAEALGMDVKDFVRELMRFYDPLTHEILFSDDAAANQASSAGISPAADDATQSAKDAAPDPAPRRS